MKKILLILISFLISISFIGSSYADFDDGLNAFNEKDFDKALYEFEPLAVQGNTDAQYYLGLILVNNRAPESYLDKLKSYSIVNNKKFYKPPNESAFNWLEKAAKGGNAKAQRELGLMYSRGAFIGRDYVKANEWWLKAALQGDVWAQQSVAFSFKKGEGLPQDYKKAMMWVKKVAEKEPVGAAHMVGDMYNEGLGTPKNNKEAVKWWGLAVDDGSIGALIKIVHQGEDDSMTSSDKFKWMKMGAEKGMQVAQFELAYMYEDGEGTLTDHNAALKWYKKSAEQGYPVAQINLALKYISGQGTLKDLTQAKFWIQKAYENQTISAGSKVAAENIWDKFELWKY